jgi:hypothetical protein
MLEVLADSTSATTEMADRRVLSGDVSLSVDARLGTAEKCSRHPVVCPVSWGRETISAPPDDARRPSRNRGELPGIRYRSQRMWTKKKQRVLRRHKIIENLDWPIDLSWVLDEPRQESPMSTDVVTPLCQRMMDTWCALAEEPHSQVNPRAEESDD